VFLLLTSQLFFIGQPFIYISLHHDYCANKKIYKNMIPLLVALLSICATSSAQSYWYILNPSVVNYTNYTTASAAAISLGLPLRIRDGASIGLNETVAPITGTLTLIGDVSGLVSAYLVVETMQSPVFVVSGSGSLLVRDLQIGFNGTLFNTQTTALLRLFSVTMWIGTIGVSVQSSSGPGVGLVAERLQCMNLGTCLLYLTTGASLNCTDCRFIRPRNAAVSVSAPTPSSIIGVNVVNSVWIDAQFFITVQPSPLAVPIQYQLQSNWGYLTNNVNTRTYVENCISPTPSQTPSPAPEFGGGGGSGTCPACPKCENTFGGPSIWNIVYLIIIGLILVVGALIMLKSVSENRIVSITLSKTK